MVWQAVGLTRKFWPSLGLLRDEMGLLPSGGVVFLRLVDWEHAVWVAHPQKDGGGNRWQRRCGRLGLRLREVRR